MSPFSVTMASLEEKLMAEYIYVLLNPAHMRYVKIGWTSKTPEERAKELSAATGVPQPFLVAYEALVPDGRAAEAIIHERLSHSGHRLNPSREFFDISLKEAIAIVDTVCQEVAAACATQQPPEPEVPLSAIELASIGSEHMYGSAHTLQDFRAARECYERAIEMGGDLISYTGLADIHLWGLGTRRAPEEAIRLLKEGGDRGFLGCYWQLWSIFVGYAIHPFSDDEDEADSMPFQHAQNADVVMGWYLDAHRQRGVPLRIENITGYLEWSHGQVADRSQTPFFGVHSKQMLEEWVHLCARAVERLREERTAGNLRSVVKEPDGEAVSLKPLLLLAEKFVGWGLSAEEPLRRILANCAPADLEYFFSSLPKESAQAQVSYFRRYLPLAEGRSTLQPLSASVADAPQAQKQSGWRKLASVFFRY